ncbi:WD and tetratricopeptide repeats protein 1 [Zootermopsis nevadensis]|uniref:WD and tetratricopeptide repeats protein 1 n=1 Tax=Zootermopsis nevadensis TaxID=136037 RepID=UPI000B8E722E|nr:WD and tetratricopeptide repeats protein 1 [Zootermopsis nevadensis]
MNRKHTINGRNIVRLTRQREVKDTINHKLQQKLHVTEDFVQRLGLEAELEGHGGCVNCLEWNESGRTLASASDDVQVILWDPFLYRKIHTIPTGHHGNIFSVKFLPKSADGVLVTGAGDCRIRVHDVGLGETTHVCNCHTGRVKRLATAPNVPYMFWSAAEDGTIMQFDLRTPHSCSREVNMGRYAEAKCLAINPQRPELLAVGANDPYIRLYDRRMIKLTTVEYPPDNVPRSNWERQNYMASRAGEGELEDNLPHGCVQYYVAGHLPVKQQDYRKKYRNLASTYVTFSAGGNELLVNLGGEQIYLFDINNKRKPKKYDIQAVNLDSLKTFKDCRGSSNGYSNGFRNGTNGFAASSNGVTRSTNGMTSIFPVTERRSDIGTPSLPIRIQALKLSANDAFERQRFTLAISLYNKAIGYYPSAAVLYGNRAAAYMKRGWDGDIYAAMRDCHTALQLDPGHMKAHFRLARCLYELQWVQEASDCMQAFKSKFPDHIHSHACKALVKDIETASASKPGFVCVEILAIYVHLGHGMGRYAEAKCLAINPQRPELLAVGANDPYIRLYDRRMIKLTTVEYPPDNVPRSNWERQNYMASRAGEGELEDNLPHGCVQYYVAGHLPVKQQDYRKKYRNLASTYVTFSAGGNELLVNLGGEQIYLFDINNKRKPKKYDIQAVNLDSLKTFKDCRGSSNGYSNGFRNGTNGFAASSNGVTRSTNGMTSIFPVTERRSDIGTPSLPIRIQALKLSANDAFERQRFTLAISLYNKAIGYYPSAAVLYGNRAAAYMKRGWDGDIYAAMRDCHTALQLDPGHMKAHFRLARCLYELQWVQEASDCMQAFKSKFPDHIHSHACKALVKDIETASASKPGFDVDTQDMDPGPEPSDQYKSHAVNSCPMSQQERAWRELAYDYEIRFCGHCNTTTDIKEANFFGSQGQYIVAGSDDGSFFIWDRHTTNIMRVLRGDDSIVNCLQPHPSYCLLATSGIDPVVRLWSPRPEDGSSNEREVIDLDDAASANQKRMNADPFEVMLMNMGYRITSVQGEEGEGGGDEGAREAPAINCRPS